MDSRIRNSKRNVISGITKQIILILLPFITRTLILYIFGELYQGLSSLFSSILEVLNIADFGFATAVVYVLYKPIANKEWEEVNAIVLFLKKTYRFVGLFIFVVGIIVMPFLPRLISGEYPSEINIYVLYLISLINVVISYMSFAYKNAIIIAMQREDIVSNTQSVTIIIIKIIQILMLLIYKNYYCFVMLNLIATFINNLSYQYYSKKLFPYIIARGKMSNQNKKVLKKQIKGIICNKIGDVARNSFDSIIISSLLGLSMVAVYGNYYYIFTSIYGIIIVISNAMQASVGNSIALESAKKNYDDMRIFTFVFGWIVSWCTVCLVSLYQPFMYLWVRGNTNLMLEFPDMLLFCIYFYCIAMTNTRNLYINGNGLYWECRVWFFVEAIGNLTLNFILGYFGGVTGILLATIITILLFNFIPRNNILFKYYFKFDNREFYMDYGIYAIVTLVACYITFMLCSFVHLGGIIGLVVRFFICCIVPNLIFLMFYFRTKILKKTVPFLKIVLKI